MTGLRAVVPGSYDPPTAGHLWLARKASEMFSEVFVYAFVNPDKDYMFTPDQRKELLDLQCRGLPNVKTGFDGGMLADFCNRMSIDVIFKGVRNIKDLGYEREMSLINGASAPHTFTMLVYPPLAMESISSTEVRKAIESGREIPGYMEPSVWERALELYLSKRRAP